jgi:hypothetical protein
MLFLTIAATVESKMIELASRESGTLHVALLWRRDTDVFTVAVDDPATGDRFDLVIDDRDPLDVYYHPYAYAALRGVEYVIAA